MTKPTRSLFKKKKEQTQSLPACDDIKEQLEAKTLVKKKTEQVRSLQPGKSIKEDLEVAGEFSTQNQEKKWKKFTRRLSRFFTWYFVRNGPPIPNTLLTRMFEYRCKIGASNKSSVKEKSPSEGNSTNKQNPLDINKSRELFQILEEDFSMIGSSSTIISESTQGEIKSNSESDYNKSKEADEKDSLRKRKLDLLTGRARLPWIEEDSFIICKKCACSKVQQEPKDISIIVNGADKNKDLLPNQKVKLDSDEVSFAWTFGGFSPDSESEYMKPKRFTQSADADLTEKLNMVKRTVELLNGRARFSWMDENCSFEEEKWKDNMKTFSNYLEDLYL